MKITSAVVGVVVLLAACESQAPTASQTRSVMPTSPNGDAFASTSLPSVTGNGPYVFPDANRKAAFSFTARELQDGSVQGQFQNFDQTRGGARVHGEVRCLRRDDPSTARLGGIVTLSDDPLIPVGTHIVWRVFDTGAGSSAPDSSTYLITARPAARNDYIGWTRLQYVNQLCRAQTATDYANAVNAILAWWRPEYRDALREALAFHALDFGNLVVH